MFTFGLGLVVGFFVGKFFSQLKGLWARTEKKIEKSLDEANK